MAVPKRKKSLLKRRNRFKVLSNKRLNYVYYKKCLVCNVFVKNHSYCLSCI